jgi:hypothetical protein
VSRLVGFVVPWYNRREVPAEVGPYEESLPQSGDWGLWLRIAARHDADYIPEPMYAYYYHMHRKNMQAKGMLPWRQTDQNLRTLDRGFAALPSAAPSDIRRTRDSALQHALPQTAWFYLFKGPRMHIWEGGRVCAQAPTVARAGR